MKLLGLASRNIKGNALRSWIVGLCAFLVAGLALAALILLRGAEGSLQLAGARLGADILVVPAGTVDKVEGAILMGHTTRVWMPADNVAAIAAVPGVAAASPQVYLSTLENASCCTQPNMFLIAYDPATDFALTPWLEANLGGGLALGEVVGGHYVFVPPGDDKINLYGYPVDLKANLQATGSGIDQSMFLTLETAAEVARLSTTNALAPLEIPAGEVSAVLVKLAPGANPRAVATEILRQTPGVTPVVAGELFHAQRARLAALRGATLTILVLTLALAVVLVGLVFLMAANARRRELGVLRAMGSNRFFVFRTLLAEAALLAAAGAAGGMLFAALILYLFRNLIVTTLNLPLLLPTIPGLALQVLAGVAVALGVITLAALLPALRVSRLDPAVAMRE